MLLRRVAVAWSKHAPLLSAKHASRPHSSAFRLPAVRNISRMAAKTSLANRRQRNGRYSCQN